MSDGQIIGFAAASLVVLVIPGPGVMYVVARSIAQGYRAGLASVLGLSLGALVHVFAATYGLSAILVSSATAFTIVKLLGAAYLIYLGIRTLLSKTPEQELKNVIAQTNSRLILDGIVISIFNPKIAVFFLAYLPQFVVAGEVPLSNQILALGLLYVAIAIVTDGCYAVLSGYVQHWYRSSFSIGRFFRYFSGLIYLGLGINTALTGRRS